MKFRRTVSSVIVSIVLVLAILVVIVQFRLSTYGMDKVQTLVQSFIPSGDLGVDITMDGMNGTLMKSLQVNGLKVSAKGNTIAEVEEMNVSLTLWDLIRLAFGKSGYDIDLTVSDVNLYATDETVNAILDIINRQNYSVPEESGVATPAEEPVAEIALEEKPAKSNPLEDLGFKVTLKNLNLYVNYNDFIASSKNINATAEVGKGFDFKGADLNVPLITASGSFMDRQIAFIRDIRVSIDQDLVASLSIASVNYGKLFNLTNTSALAQFSDGLISAALYIDNIDSSFSNDGFEMDFSLVATTANANYSLSDNVFDFVLDSSTIKGSAVVSGNALAMDVSGLDASGSYDGKDNVALKGGIDTFNAKFQDYSLCSNNLALDLSLNPSNLGTMGQLSVSHASLAGLEKFLVDSLNLNGSALDFSYSSNGLGLRAVSNINGHVGNEYVGSFSTSLDAVVQTKDFKSLEMARISLQDLSMATLKDKGSLSFEFVDKKMALNLYTGEDLNLNLNYEEGQIDLGLYLSKLHPAAYKTIYDNLLSSLGVVSDDTYLDGSIYLSLTCSEDVRSLIADAMEGNYREMPETSNAFDLIPTGRLSLNTAANAIKIGDSSADGALTFEGSFKDQTGQIDSLAVTTGGIRLGYSGSVDFSKMIPNGKLTLQNASDGSELASVELLDAEGVRKYEYILLTPLVQDLVLRGTIDWQDVASIKVDGILESSMIGDGSIDFKGVLETDPFKFNLTSDDISLQAGLEDGVVLLVGEITDMKISPNESMMINLNSGLGVAFDLSDKTFDVDLSSFSVNIPDVLNVGFNLQLTSSSFMLDSLYIGKNDKVTHFDGDSYILFDSIGDILSGKTSSVYGTIDLVAQSGHAYLKSSAINDQFYLEANYNNGLENGMDAKLEITGQRQGSFYASGALNWGKDNKFGLNAVYNDRIFSLYDTGGHMGTFQINNVDLVADFGKMVLNGSLSFLNERVFKTGDLVSQSGNITIDAKVESLATGIVQLLAGLDYTMDFAVGFTDIKLADGYSMPDIKVDMKLENNVLSMGGEHINGYFDFNEKYVDIAIDDTIPINLKMKGKVGKELDLLINDLYFPLPILNQFMDMPSFAFVDGNITGDVLLKGPSSDPSFYGMAYCQSFAMNMFYMPDQIFTVKNATMSLVDHSMVISRTPLSGYGEKDGRYFYGDIAMEIVMQGLNFELFDLTLNIDKNTPLDFWFPNSAGVEMELRMDASGMLNFGFSGGKGYMNTDINVSNTLIDFRIEEELPDWYINQANNGGGFNMDLDMKITTGHDVEFYYPEKDNSFINFTLDEDKTVELILSDGKFSTDGGLSIKTGQVYYFHNDFIIKQGSVDLSERKYSSTSFPLLLNLTAEITDYDSDGNKVVISLILQNSTLDNISPRFASTPAKDENEILAMLGQSVLASSALDQNLSLSSLATFAATATQTLQRVGILESNKSYSIGSTIRNALNLDIFSARSNILSNIIIDALPGELTGRGDVSMLARYLDNTSIFAGKYVGEDWFIRIRLMLKADSSVKLSDDVGHFLTKDLILDTEISLDWETPMGTVSVFTYPQELSVFDILDTIGFSVTKQFQF